MHNSGPARGQYLEFLRYCDSPCFSEWAAAVADDPEVCAWIDTLPEPKRQPNLVFAAARWHGVPAPGPYAGLRKALLDDDGTIRETILTRATQTNEVGRLATLTPLFWRIADGRPLALIEAGASAGLCLYPDRWDYRWSLEDGEHRVSSSAPAESPVLTCRASGPVPLVNALPRVAWRSGVDLHPLDVLDNDQMAWLETLVWPEHDDRRVTLRRAIEIARADPPRLVAGDLLEELPAVIDGARSQVGGDGRVVVFHSAVIFYLDDPGRARFERMMHELVDDGACEWVSNEGASVLPQLATRVRASDGDGRFLLAHNGRPVAWTHGHGRTMTWL